MLTRIQKGGRCAALVLAWALTALPTAPALADVAVLPRVAPEQVGMSGERLERLSALTQRYVDEGKLAGAVVLVAREGQVVHLDAVG